METNEVGKEYIVIICKNNEKPDGTYYCPSCELKDICDKKNKEIVLPKDKFLLKHRYIGELNKITLYR